jgi:hypothetical protein
LREIVSQGTYVRVFGKLQRSRNRNAGKKQTAFSCCGLVNANEASPHPLQQGCCWHKHPSSDLLGRLELVSALELYAAPCLDVYHHSVRLSMWVLHVMIPLGRHKVSVLIVAHFRHRGLQGRETAYLALFQVTLTYPSVLGHGTTIAVISA